MNVTNITFLYEFTQVSMLKKYTVDTFLIQQKPSRVAA